MKNIFATLLLILSTFFCSAQSAGEYNKALQVLQQRGEVYFSFEAKSPEQLKILSKKISISDREASTIFAYANEREFKEFVKYESDYTVLTAPSQLISVKMTDDPKQVLTWNYYPTYTAYVELMNQFANQYPDICKLITISTLASGRKILALRISDNVNVQEDEPEFLYTSTIHGDETTGYILMLHLADSLLQGYNVVDRITNMVNNFDIVIAPLTNPDGTYKGGNNNIYGATRSNANNVDLNRNFPDPEDGQHPDGNAWQPETIAFMNFAGFNSFVMGANFHGGTEVINYPWDTWPILAADDAWWIYVSREYADTVHAHSPSNYMNQYVNGITNGYAWYEITGGRQDYMNYFRHCRECTMEVSDTKLIPESQLIAHWNYNKNSLLNYIEQSGYGLHGLVTDSMSGEPLDAKVFINGFDKDSSHVYTDPQIGDYHRLLKAGTYNVTFSAAGYTPKTFNVQITDKQTTILNVQLYDGRLETAFTASLNTLAVDQQVHFTDQSAGYPQTWKWNFEGGNPSTSSSQNPDVSYTEPGTYKVKLVIARTGSSDSLVKEDFIVVKPWYLMSDKTYSVCEARFFDSGTLNGQYGNNENSIITFFPALSTEKLTAIFNSIDIEEGGADCSNDKLLVFDGISTNAQLLATFCGTSTHAPITAANAEGALTFQFVSNSANQFNGWDITLSCDSNVGIGEKYAAEVQFYPNPVTNGLLRIETKEIADQLIVRDLNGKILLSFKPESANLSISCPWPSGVYLLQLDFEGIQIKKKIQVIH